MQLSPFKHMSSASVLTPCVFTRLPKEAQAQYFSELCNQVDASNLNTQLVLFSILRVSNLKYDSKLKNMSCFQNNITIVF